MIARNMPIDLGDPVYERLDVSIAKAMIAHGFELKPGWLRPG